MKHMKQTSSHWLSTKQVLAGMLLIAACCLAASESNQTGSDDLSKLESIVSKTRTSNFQDVYQILKRIADNKNLITDSKKVEARTSTLISLLGMLMTNQCENIDLVVQTGRDPRDILADQVEQTMITVADKDCVSRCRQMLERSPKGRLRERMKRVLSKLGDSGPEKSQDSTTSSPQETLPTISAEERQSRKAEVQSLLQHVKADRMSNEQLAKAMSRIGEIGESQDATPIIEKLAGTNVHWIVRQDAYQVLGRLGGAEASDYLIKELQKPVSKDANLDDYGDTQAILRSQAALALGRCGNTNVLGILEQVATDEKQFKRVRESCNQAVEKIRGQRGQGYNNDSVEKPPDFRMR